MRPCAVLIGKHVRAIEHVGNLMQLRSAWTFRVVRFPRAVLR